jgi:hypothetical protein
MPLRLVDMVEFWRAGTRPRRTTSFLPFNLPFAMRRSGVRFISPAPIYIRVFCYEKCSKPFLFCGDVTADVSRNHESLVTPLGQSSKPSRRSAGALAAPELRAGAVPAGLGSVARTLQVRETKPEVALAS